MMYPHFIEVHDKEDDILVSVNVDCIANFFPKGDGDGAIINCRDCGGQVTIETYEELKDLIRNAGCAIQKADPRLDGTIPLTMDDLCKLEMIGEPVWNSNTRNWMLVIDSDTMHKTVDLVDNCGKIVRFDPHDVSKFPLYRMKQTSQSAREYIKRCMERKDGK